MHSMMTSARVSSTAATGRSSTGDRKRQSSHHRTPFREALRALENEHELEVQRLSQELATVNQLCETRSSQLDALRARVSALLAALASREQHTEAAISNSNTISASNPQISRLSAIVTRGDPYMENLRQSRFGSSGSTSRVSGSSLPASLQAQHPSERLSAAVSASAGGGGDGDIIGGGAGVGVGFGDGDVVSLDQHHLISPPPARRRSEYSPPPPPPLPTVKLTGSWDCNGTPARSENHSDGEDIPEKLAMSEGEPTFPGAEVITPVPSTPIAGRTLTEARRAAGSMVGVPSRAQVSQMSSASSQVSGARSTKSGMDMASALFGDRGFVRALRFEGRSQSQRQRASDRGDDHLEINPDQEQMFGLPFSAASFTHIDKDKCMLSPVGRLRTTWDCIAFLALVMDLWLTPFELIYLDEGIVPGWFDVINRCFIVWWLMDICLNFNTGFVKNGNLCMERKPSIKNYLQTWFSIDLFATIPYDWIIGGVLSSIDLDYLSVTRLAKISRMLKTMRFIKVVRLVKIIVSISRAQVFLESPPVVTQMGRMLNLVVAICVLSHLHGCVWAIINQELASAILFSQALHNYSISFRWAFYFLVFGHTGEDLTEEENPWQVVFRMVYACERIFALILFGGWAVSKAMAVFQERFRLNMIKNSAVMFFRQHSVSLGMQIKVLHSLSEAQAAQVTQRRFMDLMDWVPEDLRSQLCMELWARHLESFDFLSTAKSWHKEFMVRLCMLVKEEFFASQTLLFKAGTPISSARYLVKGRVVILEGALGRPDFTDGMWIGEAVFMSSHRRPRNLTVRAEDFSRCLAISGDGFHEIVSELKLQTRYNTYKESQLEQGLCGRCGSVGDHFTHACPQDGGFGKWLPRRRNASHLDLGRITGASPRAASFQESQNVSTPLRSYLHAHRILDIMPQLEERGIDNFEQLRDLDFDLLMEEVSKQEQRQVQLLRSLLAEQTEHERLAMQKDELYDQHLAFLSHYKDEAGTEATLMRAEFEQILKRDQAETDLTSLFAAPIFLDSEDLFDLEELQVRVQKSHNLILLLTPEVLLRPWVLVEVVTAVRHNVRVIPVHVKKRGNCELPAEEWYTDLVNGKVLNEQGTQLLQDHQISLEDVCTALKQVFKKIALPYEPHRAENIRIEEIRKILRQMHIRSIVDETSIDLKNLVIDLQSPSSRSVRARSKDEEDPEEDFLGSGVGVGAGGGNVDDFLIMSRPLRNGTSNQSSNPRGNRSVLMPE